MKPVRSLGAVPPGLRRFLDAHPATTEWETFRRDFVDYQDAEGRTAHRKLLDALAAMQRGLCAYCEIDLADADRQVEHFLPKSLRPDLTYDCANLLAACCGGKNPHSADDRRRALRPSRRSMSCGQYKDGPGANCVPTPKPTDLPPSPTLFTVYREGLLKPVAAACEQVGIDRTQLAATVDACLNLNCDRLKLARQAVWEKLEEDVADEIARLPDPVDDAAYARVMERCAEIYLLPEHDGKLPPFFTTRRAFFGSIGEPVLAERANWL
ncbi:retron system putative HNH endonuclease [Thiohalocapsa sp. ML1]|jgi:uncharacterized protein (TIGR02646 family)|uniref:retron system putative HNH endonuclease n=1 Tax=Thiohalocapsa sp. ML1 TaxID=1431688 RepID=UPI00073209D0|nr:retron system putative HNH endonuclease [Thiohalocapsa sp. ML1]